ncbi:hypothetical protein G6F31_017493 [Rhizopus arrhizus]|nr:hypothetical protein G6F31_017493 [Rhizopus arrhizus]
MGLRDLTQRRIRRADDAKHVGQRHMRDIRAAEFARHRDAAQPAGRIAFDLAPGQSAFPVALGRASCTVAREGGGGRDRRGSIPDAGGRDQARRLVPVLNCGGA